MSTGDSFLVPRRSGNWVRRLFFATMPSRSERTLTPSHSGIFTAGGLPYLVVNDTPIVPSSSLSRHVNLVLKRIFDLTVTSLGLIVLSPIFLAVVIAIRMTSPGPAIFKQRRTGFRGEVIEVYKFRSMFIDLGDDAGVLQTVAHDRRITPLGAFLRKNSLDELPQLINVMQGSMSLVGPRPHPIGMYAGGLLYEELVPYYDLRHTMRPGITGWAQSHGLRGPTADAFEAKARIDHDIAYIQNFSLWLDIVVLLRTIRYEVLTGL